MKHCLDIKFTASHIDMFQWMLSPVTPCRYSTNKLPQLTRRVTIPLILHELLIMERPDWCLPSWKQKLRNLFLMVYPLAQTKVYSSGLDGQI
jgi:hypothetical protein